MGCQAPQSTKVTVPVQNSIIHTLHTGNNKLIIAKLEQMDSRVLHEKFNFREDTLLHYACSKDNVELTKYLLSKKVNPDSVNKDRQKPADLTNNPEILKLLGCEPKQQKTENVQVEYTKVNCKAAIAQDEIKGIINSAPDAAKMKNHSAGTSHTKESPETKINLEETTETLQQKNQLRISRLKNRRIVRKDDEPQLI